MCVLGKSTAHTDFTGVCVGSGSVAALCYPAVCYKSDKALCSEGLIKLPLFLLPDCVWGGRAQNATVKKIFETGKVV